MQQRRALIPGHAGTAFDDIVALESRERDAHQVGNVELLRGDPALVRADNFKKARLVVIDKVHLVNCKYEIFNSH